MANPVTGFLANDGSFHETEAEADFRDAEDEIRQYCMSHTPNQIDDNAFLEHVEALADPIYRYLLAEERIDVEIARKEVTNKTLAFESLDKDTQRVLNNHFATVSDSQVHQADDQDTKDQLASILEQSSDRYEPMSDLGSSPPTESVLDERESNGIGGRKRHARSVRSSETLAIKSSNGPT